jgi:hypothetical protein
VFSRKPSLNHTHLCAGLWEHLELHSTSTVNNLFLHQTWSFLGSKIKFLW